MYRRAMKGVGRTLSRTTADSIARLDRPGSSPDSFLAEMKEIGSDFPEKARVKLYINTLGIPIRATGRVPKKWAIHTFTRFKNTELGRRG